MSDTFISHIHIKEVRNISNFEIPLSETERKHLIITGKNGSGKTSLLLAMNEFLELITDDSYKDIPWVLKLFEQLGEKHIKVPGKSVLTWEEKKANVISQVEDFRDEFIAKLNKLNSFAIIDFANKRVLEKIDIHSILVVFFRAQRRANLEKPSGIKKLDLKKVYKIDDHANTEFTQYIVNLKADQSFARDDGEHESVQIIEQWFNRFEHWLRQIFDSPNLQLRFDRKNYNFEIIEEGKAPFDFNTLSEGYSAVISIVTELLMRMEAHDVKNYDLEGVVLIDEIEAHLHVELQKNILPLLTSFFPKIQFIVTTHSPFVISSIPNAVICDLEKRIVTTDLSGYSYDALIESYFGVDKYSEVLKEKLARYESLSNLEEIDVEQKAELRSLKDYFDHTPKYLSKELLAKLQQIDLASLNK